MTSTYTYLTIGEQFPTNFLTNEIKVLLMTKAGSFISSSKISSSLYCWLSYKWKIVTILLSICMKATQSFLHIISMAYQKLQTFTWELLATLSYFVFIHNKLNHTKTLYRPMVSRPWEDHSHPQRMASFWIPHRTTENRKFYFFGWLFSCFSNSSHLATLFPSFSNFPLFVNMANFSF